MIFQLFHSFIILFATSLFSLTFYKMFFVFLGLCLFFYFLFYIICLCVFDCDVLTGFAAKFGKSINTLKGKVVFITGASSGIGEHIAITLAKCGVKLVLTARREQELERVKAKCIEKSKGLLQPNDIMTITMDILDVGMHSKHFYDAVNHFGQVDILVNNAGRSQRATWEDIEPSVHHQMFDLNVHAVISLTQVAIKYFQSKKMNGHVAVTSSIAGIVGVPFSGTYCGTKHAIHGYFNSLRNEKIGKDLTVTLLCPGPTATNFLAQSFTETAGQKFGVDVAPTDRRMTGKRCGYLCAVALANRLGECWMGLLPIILFTYIAVYFPNLYFIIMKIIGPRNLHKLRDGKNMSAQQTAATNSFF